MRDMGGKGTPVRAAVLPTWRAAAGPERCRQEQSILGADRTAQSKPTTSQDPLKRASRTLVDLHQRRPLVREILQSRTKRRARAKENNDEEKYVVGQCCYNWHGLFYSTRKGTGAPQSIEIAKVDLQTVAAGYRASKVIVSSVLNDASETIGKIDDLLVTRDGKEPYAVLSIGGFLGIGTHTWW